MTQDHIIHGIRGWAEKCHWGEALVPNQHDPGGLGDSTPPARRDLPDFRHVIAEAAEQQWDELVEEGVAVTEIQQPFPHHRGHCLPDLPHEKRSFSRESLGRVARSPAVGMLVLKQGWAHPPPPPPQRRGSLPDSELSDTH